MTSGTELVRRSFEGNRWHFVNHWKLRSAELKPSCLTHVCFSITHRGANLVGVLHQRRDNLESVRVQSGWFHRWPRRRRKRNHKVITRRNGKCVNFRDSAAFPRLFEKVPQRLSWAAVVKATWRSRHSKPPGNLLDEANNYIEFYFICNHLESGRGQSFSPSSQANRPLLDLHEAGICAMSFDCFSIYVWTSAIVWRYTCNSLQVLLLYHGLLVIFGVNFFFQFFHSGNFDQTLR